MLEAIGKKSEDTVVIKDDNLPEVAEELASLWPPESVPEGTVETYMRPLVFTTFDPDWHRRNLEPVLRRCPPGADENMISRIYGRFVTAVDQHPHSLDKINNCVCWPTYNFGTVYGCSHGCLYCSAGREGRFLTIALNLEDYMTRVVKPVIDANPWNRVFRMILNNADLITLEPEYGLHSLFADTLAQYEDRWGYFHTASSNVDWLRDVPNRDRLIGVWSVTCEKVAREIERGTGHAADRIEAAGKCLEMGIPVRYKFKPIIPVRNWEEEYARIIAHALERTDPESIGFCMFVWNSYESLVNSINPDLLDPRCLEAAREAREDMKGSRQSPFPHDIRKEIYRFFIKEIRSYDMDLPLYVSTETREMWDELKDELGQDPRCYICGCSSVAAPGRRMAVSPGFRYSTYNPAPL